MAKSNRNMCVVLLLNLITCGIYGLFYWRGVEKDTNRICSADGKSTMNFWLAFLLGVITCGIFTIVWQYQLVERVFDAGKRYGVSTSCSGTTFLLWALIGSLICGIGPLIALHKQIKDLNLVAAAYNAYGVAK